MKDRKTLGILAILVVVFGLTALGNPQFVSVFNLENILRWTGLYGILGLGVAFVIVTGGIDLSIGSVVGLVGVLLPWLLERGFGAVPAVLAVLAVGLLIGLAHGLLITRLRLPPFVVTLCGLLIYRGAARWIPGDQTLAFGTGHDGLRSLAIGFPIGLPLLMAVLGGGLAIPLWFRFRHERGLGFPVAAFLGALGLLAMVAPVPVLSELRAPAPLLVLFGAALLAALVLNETVWGRYLYALGRNETAARYSGIRTERMTVAAYAVCSLLAGVGGVLFALDVNSIQPAMHGNFYELYAIAAAVLGGWSLRGGEGTVLGVLLGTALLRVLYNAINLLGIPTQLEFAIIGAVILLGVVADELVRRMLGRRGR
ncbi:MAG TPA: ABC transporter permease [Planctomycetota bacterium]